MENEDDFKEESNRPEVEIYSKRAIWWFSILLSPLFGAALLVVNLWQAGYRSKVFNVVIFTITWYLLSNVVASHIPRNQIFILFVALALNIAGGAILAEYFFVKYFPEKDYYPKSIVTPIFISLLILIPFSIMMLKMGLIK